MIDLFAPEGLAALERLSRQETLYAFDFDGTLAPIVTLPKDAQAAEATVSRLQALGRLVPTALVTGRSTDDLRRRIAFTPSYLIGNHGAEGIPGLSDEALSANAAHRETVLGWIEQWPVVFAAGDEPGVSIERKAYSLSVHYRAAVDRVAAARAIAEAIERLDPAPRVIGGKCVFNLLPDGAPDKGLALKALVRFGRCDAAFFIGDDLTDEAAFLDAPDSWVTVRVGRSVDSAARYFIEDQPDIDRCLDRLIEYAVGRAAQSAARSVDPADQERHAGEGLPARRRVVQPAGGAEVDDDVAP